MYQVAANTTAISQTGVGIPSGRPIPNQPNVSATSVNPVTAPTAVPTANAAATATSAFTSSPTTDAATAPVSARSEPTDRSIPDVRITSVMPTAIMALTEVC